MSNAELERNYECPHCGMKAIVVVRGERSLTPFQKRTESTVSLSIEDGMRRQDDATKTLGLVACPSCGRRPALAPLWSALRVLGVGIGAVFATMVGTRRVYLFWRYVPFIFVIGLGIGAWFEVRRWHAAGKIVVVRMISGPPPKAVAIDRPAPPKKLEPAPPPKKVEPAKIEPAPVIERDLPPPADPSQGPRFLK